ncbi:MAG: LLM class flavin-dependent oxidoreductase [Chloroflexi bacterium]|nr:LLM class flavin-dependent oxidoreductase [Chloroflexota bacterium]
MVPERLDFGIFLAPFHPAGENPTLALRRDIELITWLDELGYDEVWAGEHHSGGWEISASPEMFLAVAGEHTSRIRLGTGVVSLPYHHPFHVADRIVELDHLTRGRAMLGVGPGALPGDAHFLGIESTRQRPMMDEALGIILRLLTEEEPISYKSDWFELRDAQLQLKPIQRPTMPIAVASTISPAGMTSAGKHGAGVLSVASFSEEGLSALTTQWGFCETAAKEAGREPPDRHDWRIVLPIHLAATREQAISEIEEGLMGWNNDYFVGTIGAPNRKPVESGRAMAEAMNAYGGAIIGTPDDAIERISKLQELSGGFGCLLGLAHDWATREQTFRSYELLAKYVMPEVQDQTSWIKRSQAWTHETTETLMGKATQAVVKAIQDYNETHPRDGDGKSG